MATWNPNTPGSFGLEWSPTVVGSLPLATDADAVAVAFTAATTRNVAAIDLLATVRIGGVVCIELFTEADYLATPVGDTVFAAYSAPTADIVAAGFIDALPHWSKLVGDPFAYDATYVTAPYGVYSWERNRFASLTVAAGQRVLNLRFASLVALAASVPGSNPPVYRRLFMDDLAAAQYTFTPTPTPLHAGMTACVTGECRGNPTSRAPWTRADITAWAAGATFGTDISTSSDGQLRLFNHRVYADYAVERRLAWATPTVAAAVGVQRIQSGALTLASTGAAGSVTLTAGQRYVVMVRRAPAVPAGITGMTIAASLVVPLIAPTPPLVGYSVSRPALDVYGRPHAGHTSAWAPTLAETAVAGGVPLVTLVGGVPDAGDLSPYHTAQLYPVYGSGVFGVLRQIVTATGAGNYNLVRALVARGPTGTTLTARLRVRTTLAQVGGTGTITAAQWDLLPDTDAVIVEGRQAKAVTFQLASLAALTAVDYAVDFEASAASAPGADWAVVGLVGETAHSVASYGGAGFPALTYGGVVQAGVDAPALVQVPPTAPGVPIAPVVTVAISESDDNTTPTSGYWQVVNVQWTATALGAAFARYEIERNEASAGWVPIGWVTTEGGFPHFADYEGRRGVSTVYRVRVVRADFAVSPWVTSPAATPVAQGCTIGLVVNGTWEGTWVSGIYQDVDDLRTVSVLDEVVYRQMHAGNYQVAFRQAERRGVRWGLQLLVYSGTPLPGQAGPVVAGLGLAQYDHLRRIARQDAPYVAVIDNEGGRIFAGLQVPELRRRPNGQVYYAAVVATELTDVPVVHARA